MNTRAGACVVVRVLSLVMLMSLSQAGGLLMWTDSDGVVHVGEAHRAPARAKPLSGEGYSRIDDDGRPAVMADGGTRDDDSAWWKARFAAAREALAAAKAQESQADAAVHDATREVCATATAEATNTVVFVGGRTRGRGFVNQRGGGARTVRLSVGAPARYSQTVTSTSTNCERGTASAAQYEAAHVATGKRRDAERALRELEQQARSASVPLRYWR